MAPIPSPTVGRGSSTRPAASWIGGDGSRRTRATVRREPIHRSTIQRWEGTRKRRMCPTTGRRAPAQSFRDARLAPMGSSREQRAENAGRGPGPRVSSSASLSATAACRLDTGESACMTPAPLRHALPRSRGNRRPRTTRSPVGKDVPVTHDSNASPFRSGPSRRSDATLHGCLVIPMTVKLRSSNVSRAITTNTGERLALDRPIRLCEHAPQYRSGRAFRFGGRERILFRRTTLAFFSSLLEFKTRAGFVCTCPCCRPESSSQARSIRRNIGPLETKCF